MKPSRKHTKSPVPPVDGAAQAVRRLGGSLPIRTGKTEGGRTEEVQAASRSLGSNEAQQFGNLLSGEIPYTSWVDNSKWLIDALHDVAKIHPYVNAAVTVFTCVLTLELKRRENNRMVTFLYTRMNDTMSVLINLKTLPTSSSIIAKIGRRLQNIEADVKLCANACDKYLKSHKISQFLKMLPWAEKFNEYADKFVEHRQSLLDDLAALNTLGIEAVKGRLGNVAEQMKRTEKKIDALLFLESTRSPKDQELLEFIKEHGGAEEITKDGALLKKIAEKSVQIYSPEEPIPSTRAEEIVLSILEDFKTDLAELLDKHMKKFTGKLDLQLNDIKDTISKQHKQVMEMLAGPYERINDLDIRQIWKDWGWKGSVKSRTFVLALRETFSEPAQRERLPLSRSGDSKKVEWASRYLTVTRLQSLIESFDDDASGFVTVKEVNDLTFLKPPGWSVPEWLAFWAAGFHISMIVYCDRISSLLRRMHRLAESVLPENRQAVSRYLSSTGVNLCDRLLAGIHSGIGRLRWIDREDDKLVELVMKHIQYQVNRMRVRLEQVRFDIDHSNTLALVTGPGRVEMHALPVIYLLLSHHCRLMELCQQEGLHDDELPEAAESLECLWDALVERMRDLRALFQHQHLNPDLQFRGFCAGLFSYLQQSPPHNVGQYQYLDFSDIQYRDVFFKDQEKASSSASPALKYGFQPPIEPLLALQAPKKEPEPLPFVAQIRQASLEAARRNSEITPPVPELTSAETTSPAQSPPSSAFASAESSPVLLPTSPPALPEQELVLQAFPKHWDRRMTSGPRLLFASPRGSDVHEMHLPTRDRSDASSGTELPVTVAPSEYSGYTDDTLMVNPRKARALWWAAGSMVLGALQEPGRLSRTLLVLRRMQRKRYIDLWVQSKHLLTRAESEEHEVLTRTMARTGDLEFYQSLAEFHARRQTMHSQACDNCSVRAIHGTRFTCLTCWNSNEKSTINLCMECAFHDCKRNDKVIHRSTHSIVRVRTVLYQRSQAGNSCFRNVMMRAKMALDDVKELYVAGNVILCRQCYRRTDYPHWVCTICEIGASLCPSCIEREDLESPWLYERAEQFHLRSEPQRHHWSHPLIWCPHPDQPAELGGSRNDETPALQRQEERLDKVGERLEQIEERLDRLGDLMMQMMRAFEST